MDALTWFIFIVVGVIVSFDVTGLTLSQVPNFTRQNRSIFLWALSNALWHSVLLLIYILVISGFFSVSFGIIDFLERSFLFLSEYLSYLIVFKDYSIVVFKLLREHASLILGIVTLLIVWNVYSSKIVSKPELGNRDELPVLAKVIFDFLEIIVRIFKIKQVSPNSVVDFLNWQASAALVAVDMLALAALLKSMGYLETYQQRISVVLIVFFVVLIFAWMAGKKGHQFYTDYSKSIEPSIINQCIANSWVLITLRIAEPFLIFYFVLELLAFLIFREKIHSVGFFFGAVLLLWGLVNKHTLNKIVECTLFTNSKQEIITRTVLRQFKDIFTDFLFLLKILVEFFLCFILSIVLLIGFTYLMYDNPDNIISLDTLISKIMSFISIILLVTFILPFKWCEKIEYKVVYFLEIIHENRHVFLFIIGALIIAATFPIFEYLTGEALNRENGMNIFYSKKFGLKPNHIHALQAGIWLAYFFFVGILLEILEKKYHVDGKGFS